jgi:hypothetical protein
MHREMREGTPEKNIKAPFHYSCNRELNKVSLGRYVGYARQRKQE